MARSCNVLWCCRWWVGCDGALGRLRSLCRVNGRAQRVVWKGAGQVSRGAFGAWLPIRKAILQMPPGRRGRGKQRERAYPGKPSANGVPVNPTFRPEQPAAAPQGPAEIPTVDLGDYNCSGDRVAIEFWAFRTRCYDRLRAAFLLRLSINRSLSGLRNSCRSWLERSMFWSNS